MQRANLVFGLEADIQGSGISDSKTLTAATSNALSASLNLKTSLDYFGTVRGRAGYAPALSTSSARTGRPKLSINTSTWVKTAFGPRPPRRISPSLRFALA